MTLQKSIDKEVLFIVISRHLRTPQQWLQADGALVHCGPQALADRIAHAYAAEFIPLTESDERLLDGNR